MTENAIATIAQNENSFLGGHSKEAIIITNNLLTRSRAFGRDISNIHDNETTPMNSIIDKYEIQLITNDQTLDNEMKTADTSDSSFTDLSMADFPKSMKDPIIASRELLAAKPTLEKNKESIKPEALPRKLQKVSLNLFAMENCDILEINNPQYASVYAKEIFKNLKADENKHQAKFGYFAQIQNEINERMRAILVDWLVEIHNKFKLLPETLYLTVNLLDRFLEKVQVTKQNLQLVGITSMLIASKYQEIYPPEVRDFVHVSDKAYTREEILEMEGNMLRTLQFNLTVPTSWIFLERFSRLTNLDKKSSFFSQYIIELALCDYIMLKYSPSVIAWAAIQLTGKVFRKRGADDIVSKHAKQDENNIKICCQELLLMLKGTEKSSLKASKKKFNSVQYLEVSKTQIDFL